MSDTPALPAPASKDADLTPENLASVIAWNFRRHVDILAALNERLDRIEVLQWDRRMS